MSGVYSYHTFIFPFIWEGSKQDNKNLKDFIRCFSENPAWKDVTFTDQYSIAGSELNNDTSMDFYKEYQYFYPHVRKALFGFESNIVKIFSFMPSEIKKGTSHYIIEKDEDNFSLNLRSIRLKIYNTGVALLVTECDNDKYKSIEEVKKINDYGRRITVPFISSSKGITADKLNISINGVKDFVSDFRKFSSDAETSTNLKDTISLTHIADSIIELLNYNNNYHITSRRSDNEKYFHIYPALDDRMYVACYVTDKAKADEYCSRYPFDDYDSQAAGLDSEFYSLAYIDPKDCTCQNREMRLELIKKSAYVRWTEYGSIYTIANQGMICVTGADDYYLRFNFTDLYIKFAELCLVQATSVKNFQRQVSNLSANVEQKGKTIKKSTLKDLTNLQERVVAFESQLHFTEVSSEEQAIEMYTMVYDSMRIDRELEQLKSQLSGLYETASTDIETDINRLGWAFAVYEIIFGIFTHIYKWEKDGYIFNHADERGFDKFFLIWELAPIVIIAIVLIVNHFNYGRRKK